MRTLILIAIGFVLTPSLVFAKKGGPETEAIYIVPSPPELVSHSRFKMKIIEPYKGPETEIISYIFPEILIGEKDRLIELNRIEGTDNSWTSELVDAHCSVIEDTYSCNVHVNKPEQAFFENKSQSFAISDNASPIKALCQGKAIAHLNSLGLPERDFNKFSMVIGQFCSGEPAGFFSYEFN